MVDGSNDGSQNEDNYPEIIPDICLSGTLYMYMQAEKSLHYINVMKLLLTGNKYITAI